MDINNPDIRLVVQLDFPTNLDVMIQRLRQASRDGKPSTFILIRPNWSNIKDSKELEQCRNIKNLVQLSHDHQPKAYPLSQVFEADTISDTESLAEFEIKSNYGFAGGTNKLLFLLATKGELEKKNHSTNKKTSKSDAERRVM